jgi:tryptophan aminotransferase
LDGEPGVEEDSYDVILSKGLERGVLALPGAGFFPNSRKTAYVRASFSAAPAEEVDEALKRLREVIIAARASNKK